MRDLLHDPKGAFGQQRKILARAPRNIQKITGRGVPGDEGVAIDRSRDLSTIGAIRPAP